MSILWTITAGCLYAEAAIVAILLLPIISSRSWNRIFNSGLVKSIAAYGSFYFTGFLAMLGLMLFEAIRHVRLQNAACNELKSNPSIFKPETENVYLMKLFRAQRNLYISGFSLFLWFVLRRLVTLIADHARVTATGEASIAQAKSATEAAQRLLATPLPTEIGRETESDAENDELRDEIDALKAKLITETEARKSADTKVEAIKKQAEQITKEYDRVSEECQQLQKELASVGRVDGSKKGN